MRTRDRAFWIESTKTVRNGNRLWRVTDGNFSWIVNDIQTAIRNCDQLNAEKNMPNVRKVA